MLIVIGLLVSTPALASADDRLDPTAVDRWVADYLRAEGLPGAAVSVIHRRRDRGGGRQSTDDTPITATTEMSIGSVSKMITAFAVLQLVDQDEVDLDGPVIDQLPEFVLDDPRGAQITVRQLLDHTSGLPNPLVIPAAQSPAERVTQLRTIALGSDRGSPTPTATSTTRPQPGWWKPWRGRTSRLTSTSTSSGRWG